MVSTSSLFPDDQAERRALLRSLLGPLPQPTTSASAEAVRRLEVSRHPGFILERLELPLNGLEPVPALLLLPERRPARAGGLLYVHAHGGAYGLGKEELLLGRTNLPAYASVCAELGLVTLAIDSWCFGARQHDSDGRRGEQDAFKLLLWQGQTLWGHMLFDEMQALTYLATRPEVDPQRLGVFGMSMGATKAWWLAALEPRIRLCIDLCCLTDYQELIRMKHLSGHGVYYYVPGLLHHFQTHQITELIVPRPHLSLNGRRDPLTPPAGVERVRDHLEPLYAQHGKREDVRIELFDCGHEETPEMRRLVIDWLSKHLSRS